MDGSIRKDNGVRVEEALELHRFDYTGRDVESKSRRNELELHRHKGQAPATMPVGGLSTSYQAKQKWIWLNFQHRRPPRRSRSEFDRNRQRSLVRLQRRHRDIVFIVDQVAGVGRFFRIGRWEVLHNKV
jgi:hypothetical protein